MPNVSSSLLPNIMMIRFFSIPEWYFRWNPFPEKLRSETNLTNMWLLEDRMLAGWFAEQNLPRDLLRSSIPSNTLRKTTVKNKVGFGYSY